MGAWAFVLAPSTQRTVTPSTRSDVGAGGRQPPLSHRAARDPLRFLRHRRGSPCEPRRGSGADLFHGAWRLSHRHADAGVVASGVSRFADPGLCFKHARRGQFPSGGGDAARQSQHRPGRRLPRTADPSLEELRLSATHSRTFRRISWSLPVLYNDTDRAVPHRVTSLLQTFGLPAIWPIPGRCFIRSRCREPAPSYSGRDSPTRSARAPRGIVGCHFDVRSSGYIYPFGEKLVRGLIAAGYFVVSFSKLGLVDDGLLVVDVTTITPNDTAGVLAASEIRSHAAPHGDREFDDVGDVGGVGYPQSGIAKRARRRRCISSFTRTFP